MILDMNKNRTRSAAARSFILKRRSVAEEHSALRRNTRQRQVILDELKALTSHPTAVELHEIVRRRLPKISLGTVYRNLDLLARLGRIEKLEHAGGEARYDANTEEHDHLRCTRCGRVDDIMTPPLDLGRPEDHHLRGYEVHGRRLEYLGICPACRENI